MAAAPTQTASPTRPPIDHTAQVIVFGYHRFEKKVRRPDTEITPEAFEAQMKQLQDQKIAVIGYYLAHLAPISERRDYLGSEDIRPCFIEAGFELPTSSANTALINAKNAGYLSVLDRGKYKLTAVGHNLVAHKLPGHEAGQTKSRHKARRNAKK